MPDIVVTTYLRGHTWEKAGEKIIQKIKAFRERKTFHIFSSFYLGWMIHYIEDFFTYPHNQNFAGSLREHITYEKELSASLLNKNTYTKCDIPADKKDLEIYLKLLHESYLSEADSIEKDIKYIYTAATAVYEYLVRHALPVVPALIHE